jgi:hypothetical protein
MIEHIVSQGNRRLNHDQPWAERPFHPLRSCILQHVHRMDVSNDGLVACHRRYVTMGLEAPSRGLCMTYVPSGEHHDELKRLRHGRR